MEGNAEFYSSPQLAVLGMEADATDGLSDSKKFQLAMDRLLALTRDEDGNVPELKQLQQATMQPHSDMLRTVASAFSGETGIPLSSLGVIHDNPASAEAIRAAEHDLLIDATYHNKFIHGAAAKDIATLAVMVRDGLTEAPAEAWRLSASFADPEFRSTSANADAYVKLAGANPDLANSPVLLETVFDGDQIARFTEERKRAHTGGVLQSLIASAQSPQGVANGGSVAGAVPAS